MKTIDAFLGSTAADAPPEDLAPALQALWWVRKGDWDRAHKVVQGHESDRDCDWVHAHLPRQEGDLSNGGYWYRHAGNPVATGSLEEEWEQVTTALLHPPSRA